jgi:hypothetical protein
MYVCTYKLTYLHLKLTYLHNFNIFRSNSIGVDGMKSFSPALEKLTNITSLTLDF